MRGRAHTLLSQFRDSLSGIGAPFLMSRLILKARIIPEEITEDLDDPAIEQRLADAIAALRGERSPGRAEKK
jgi:hypothetical protein